MLLPLFMNNLMESPLSTPESEGNGGGIGRGGKREVDINSDKSLLEKRRIEEQEWLLFIKCYLMYRN
ncbi:MAG: hypothetical protein ABI760_15005 [Ferruginibacter sp.]